MRLKDPSTLDLAQMLTLLLFTTIFFSSCTTSSHLIQLPKPQYDLGISSPLVKDELPSVTIARKYAFNIGKSGDPATIYALSAMVQQYGAKNVEHAIKEVTRIAREEHRPFTVTEIKFYAEYYSIFGSK